MLSEIHEEKCFMGIRTNLDPIKLIQDIKLYMAHTVLQIYILFEVAKVIKWN